MIRILIFILFNLLVIFPASANCDEGEKKIVFGVAANDVTSIQSLAAGQLKILVDRDLQGKVCLQVIFDKEKFADDQIINSLKTGAAVLALPRLSSVAKVVREYEIFGLPFAFSDFQSVSKFQASTEFSETQKKLINFGMQSFGYVHQGFDQLVQKKQVVNPEDAIGVRFDVTNGGVFVDFVSGVKGISKRRNNKTVAQSLTDGDFDIAPVTWTDLADAKLRQSSTSVVETNHAYRGYQVAVNSAWLSSLDESLRKDIEQTIRRGINQIAFEAVRRERAARNSLMRANKPVFGLSRDQWLRWRASMSRVWNSFEKAHGLELVAALQDANRLP